MAIIRPLNENDLQEMGGEVKFPISKSEYASRNTPDSVDIFGERRVKNGVVDETVFTQKGYINLAIPVVNLFLAGKEGQTFKKVFGDNQIEAVIEGNLVYQKSTNRYIGVQDPDFNKLEYDKYDQLIGGDLILYLIDNFDPETHIKSILYDYVRQQLVDVGLIRARKDDCTPITEFCTIVKGSGQLWVIDDYYMNLISGVSNEDIEDLKERIELTRESLVREHNSRLTYLLAVNDDMDRLRELVMHFLVLTPIGFRPKAGNRIDPMTSFYSHVVVANSKLLTSMSNTKVMLNQVVGNYKDLVYSIKEVMVEEGKNAPTGYKSLMTMLIGKNGLFRDEMHGVRMDYTGRSVIIVDPKMPIDTIGIPRGMAEKLMQLEILKEYRSNSGNRVDILSRKNEFKRKKIAEELLEGSWVISGRQPTLFQLGMRGFKAKIVDGNAIVLSPLVVVAFNADFDGDQMYVKMPVSEEAKKEVGELMSVVNNVFWPRSGDIHIFPRQEIIYGLWYATKVEPRENSNHYVYDDTFNSYNEIITKVKNQEINIYDTIEINGNVSTAGRVAVRASLKSAFANYRLGVLPLTTDPSKEEVPVKEAWFKEMFKLIAMEKKGLLVEIASSVTDLGFSVANIHPPCISILDVPSSKHLIDEFDKDIEEAEDLYNCGIMTEAAYTTFYNARYERLDSDVKANLEKELGENNGWIQMVKSGARGSMSNVSQLFGMKGRIKKNESESFNSIIKHPLATQLTGLEHFATCYGSREGVIEKTITTADPGYLERLMEHSTNIFSIVTEDCGTTDGILLNYDLIKQFIPHDHILDNEYFNVETIRSYFVKLITGRYIVGIPKEIKDETEAGEIFDTRVASVNKEEETVIIKEGVKLRSILKCKNPCCVKCYGKDLGTNHESVVGLPIGFIAAQSIGEPSTQMTMKNFQSGGVAGIVNLTSSFDTVSDLSKLHDPANKKMSNGAITYDFISPVDGYTRTVSLDNGVKRLIIYKINDKGKEVNLLKSKIIIPENLKIKEYVKVGDSIQEVQGDLSPREIMKYRSVEDAQVYIMMKLYDLFQKEVYVSLKHFEVLVAGMTLYLCLHDCVGDDGRKFKTGHFYTLIEKSHAPEDGKFSITLEGIKRVPLFRDGLFSNIFMEEVGKGINRSIIISRKDDLSVPITRTLFGLNLKMGSDIPGYIEQRGKL